MSNHTSPRVPYTRLAAEAFKGLLATSQAVHDSSIDPTLMELVFLRVSQLNGCGYCMDMHGTALRKGGIEPRKLDTLPAYCRTCDVRFACNGGCPKDRFTTTPDGESQTHHARALVNAGVSRCSTGSLMVSPPWDSGAQARAEVTLKKVYEKIGLLV